MSARHFGYYDDWKVEVLTCPKCGWSGSFEQGSVEHHDELMDSSCPVCAWPDAPMLAIVSYPTLEESEAHIDSLTQSDKESLARRKQFLAHFEGGKLKSPSDLPDLSAPRIVLLWDFDENNKATVIKHEDRIIWSEAAIWEGAERFVEVVGILKQKYGRRLYDVVPTDASGLYLHGDRLSSIGVVERTRANLRAG